MSEKPIEKQITVTFSSEATRNILDAAKTRLSDTPDSDPEALFLEELTAVVTRGGLSNIVDSVSTNSKFAAVVSKGN